VQIICIWCSWRHSHLIVSCFIKIQSGLPFWCRLTRLSWKRGHWPGVRLSCVVVPFDLLMRVDFCCVGFNFVHNVLSDCLGKTSPEMTHFHVERDAKPRFSQSIRLDQGSEWMTKIASDFTAKITYQLRLLEIMFLRVKICQWMKIAAESMSLWILWSVCWKAFHFVSERELTFTFAICHRPSVCLSVVCNVRAPYSGGSSFRQYFYGIRYVGHPLTPSENFTEIVPGEPLRRGS